MMYEYRRMTPSQREEVLRRRKLLELPWHEPPHFGDDEQAYIISAACYGHRFILSTPERRSEWEASLMRVVEQAGGELFAWVVLPNHYHLLVRLRIPALRPLLGRLHNGKSTQWNREDGTPGRKSWHRFSDRRIRGERHHYASLNYIHMNPVKHGYVSHPSEWPWSSFSSYVQAFGEEQQDAWLVDYPIEHYGEGWDD